MGSFLTSAPEVPTVDFEQIIAMLGGMAVVGVVSLVVLAVTILLEWLFFKKMGEPGWKIFIPLYNTYIIFKRCWNTGKFWKYVILTALSSVLSAVSTVASAISPIAGGVVLAVCGILSIILAVMGIKLTLRISYSFNHGVLFGLGLLLFPWLFFPILILGRSRYAGPFVY